MASERGEDRNGEPEEILFVSGVDYVSAWRIAHEAAREINQAAESLGVDGRLVNAVPHAGAHGEAVVWMRSAGARELARALRNAAFPKNQGENEI